jgi:FMN phosphatase YigB (HAD superfamily)
MASERRLGFLLDVDNTLLDNDALKDYLSEQLSKTLGAEGSDNFWRLYEEVRRQRDVVDLPLTVERYVVRSGDAAAGTQLRQILDTILFPSFVYPHAFETLRRLKTLGATTILSDGDSVFQARKIERSGLAAAVDNHVLIYIHKEDHLDEVAMAQPADHSVIVDDKARILANVKRILGDRVTTVHVLQGHYAQELVPGGFTPDIAVQGIGDLRAIDAARFQ